MDQGAVALGFPVHFIVLLGASKVLGSMALEACDLVVSHGGSGSMLAALDHGLPMVNVPIAADQPLNAARCAEAGVGLTVGPHERTPEVIRTAVRAVLSDPRYRLNAQRLRASIRAMPVPESAVMLLERLAVEKRPIGQWSLDEPPPITKHLGG